MKWFKHQSDLQRYEGVSAYLDSFDSTDRLAAYGFLMLVMEIIAERMTFELDHPNCSATFSLREWSRLTNCHPNRVDKYLPKLGVIGWVTVTFEGSSCKVEIPKLLKWRDEYTRKKARTPDKVAQIREEQNRIDKNESRQGDDLSKGIARTSYHPPANFVMTAELRAWAANHYPTVNIDRETEKFHLYPFPDPISNWESRWKRWIIQAAEHQEKYNGSTGQPSRIDALLKLGKDLRIKQKPDESDADYGRRVEIINQRRIEKEDL